MNARSRAKQTRRLAAIKHTQLYLSKAKVWSADFTTARAPEVLAEMDRQGDNINKALARLIHPQGSMPLETIRDAALTYYDYYEKRSRWQEWIALGQAGLVACEQLGDAKSLGEAYPALCQRLGMTQRMLGNWDKAVAFYQSALERATRVQERVDAWVGLADVHRLLGKSKEAMQYAEQAVALGQKIQDKNREALGLEYLGLAHVGLRQYDDGVDCYEQALQLRNQTNHLPRQAMALSYLAYALTHRNQGDDLQRAVEYNQQACEIEILLKNEQSLGRLYGDIAEAYNKLGQYERAEELSHYAYDYNIRIGYQRAATLNQARLMQTYMGMEKFEMALDCADYVCEHLGHLTAFDLSNLRGLGDRLLALARRSEEVGEQERGQRYRQSALEVTAVE